MIQGSESIQAFSNTDRSKVVQGAASLRIECSGYGMLKSNAFSTRLLERKDQITLLLRMPESLGNPWWAGAVDLFVSSPSANQFRQPLGHIDLQGKPLGKWSPLSFAVPTYLQSLFSEGHDDVYFEIALNTAAGTGPFYLDGLGGLDSRYSVRIEEGEDASVTVLFWDHSTTQAQLQYTINNGAPQSAAMTGLEGFDRFDAKINGLVPGDQITWQVRFQNDGEWMETGWSTYTTLGQHKYVSVGDEVRQVGLYTTSKPIVIKPEWSTRYAVLITRRALTNAEQATAESMGVNILGTSHSAHHGYYTISYTGNINTLAQSLQTSIAAFFNIAPMTKAKPVQRAAFPITEPGEALNLLVACKSDVSLAECKAAIQPFAEAEVKGLSPIRGLSLYATEFSLDLLRLQDCISSIQEKGHAPETIMNARRAQRIDNLQSRLGFDTFLKDKPIGNTWLQGLAYTGEDIHINFSEEDGVNPNVEDLQEDGLPRYFTPEATWVQNIEDEGLFSTTPYFGNLGNHGTAVAGIALGNGARSPNLTEYTHRGIAPKAHFYTLTSIDLHVYADPGHVSNHSHGGITNSPLYTYFGGMITDNTLHSQDFFDGKRKSIVVSAANEGFPWNNSDGSPKADGLNRPLSQYSFYIDWYSLLWSSKNTIIVGATDYKGHRSDYSSMGPTIDGRIKPDVMAVGGQYRDENITVEFPSAPFVIVQGISTSPEPYVSHAGTNGTSFAAPVVSGIIALMQQKLRNDILGCTPSVPCPAFESNSMRNSTAKAILIQTARDMEQPKNSEAATYNWSYDQSGAEKRDSYVFFGKGPDFATGWGWVNGEKAVDYVDPTRFAEVEIQAEQIQEFYFDLPANPTEDLNLTIAWDDLGSTCPENPEFDPLANKYRAYVKVTEYIQDDCQLQPLLINDIDLYLEAPNGQKFYPWKLKPFLGPQSWDKMPYNPNVGLDNIDEERIERNIAYRGCQKNEDPSNIEESVENCFDHLNNVEKVTVYNSELFDLDILGFNKMSGRWKAVIKGKAIQGEQIVSISSDYPITTSSDAIRNLWVDFRYHGGVDCIDHFFPISGNLYTNTDVTNTSSLNLCATRDIGSLHRLFNEDGLPLTSILVSGLNSAPALYSPVPNYPSLENMISFGTPPYGLNLNPNGNPPIYIYTSTEPILGTPIIDVKTTHAFPDRIEADTGWIRIPQEIHQSADGQKVFLSYKNADTRPITDLFIAGDDKNATCPVGYEFLSGDLNRGAIGLDYYLCGSRDPSKGLPIVELKTITGPQAIPNGFEIVRYPLVILGQTIYTPINLNNGTSSEALWLFQRRSATEAPILDISYVSWFNDNVPVPQNWSILDQNLNEGTVENYVYLVFKK